MVCKAKGRIPNGTGNQVIVQVALAQEGNGGVHLLALVWIWAAGCHGVPVSYRGAGSSAVILRVVPCRNFPSVRMVQSGSRVKDSLRMEVMFRQRGILFSLTGKMTEALTM